MFVQRTGSQFHLAICTNALQASLVCPFRGKERYALFYTMSASTNATRAAEERAALQATT